MVQQTSEQLLASDPQYSVWVGASAGTGKTFVLTNRVLRLMLAGTRPDKILCLTYTNTAAAEMAIRVNNRLAKWISLDDSILFDELCELLGCAPNQEQISLSKRLFADVLDVPGGLKIQTIHSFCQSLLGRFPIEAHVSPGFDLLDEITINEQLRLSRDELLLNIHMGEDNDLKNALTKISQVIAETTFVQLMKSIIAERDSIDHLFDINNNSVKKVISSLKLLLGLSVEDTRDTILDAACSDKSFNISALKKASQILKTGRKTDVDRGEIIANWINQKKSRKENFENYKKAYLRSTDGDFLKTYMTKDLALANGAALETLIKEAERVKFVTERLKAFELFENTTAILRLGDALLTTYKKRKKIHNVMDYDDLIMKVRNLLKIPGGASWVLYKLDEGIDHILIDEAQDTNPSQWEVIRHLAFEYFAGIGTRDEQILSEHPRTIFAVGDVKQSIYSFQKADPKHFVSNGDVFMKQAQDAGLQNASVPMNLSFRSTSTILNVVDQVFKNEEDRKAISFSLDEIHHDTSRAGEAGLVEIWETIKPVDEEPDDDWSPPVIQTPEIDPRRMVAERIADQIKQWLDNGEKLKSKDCVIKASDILILVQKRKEFVNYMIRALKARNIPVAGLDRMELTDQLAVMDLIAAAKFTLLPEDDLNLAIVLRSPLIGLDEDDLFELAYHREDGEKLWDAMLRRKNEKNSFKHAAEALINLTTIADFQPPYEFFNSILGPMGGRKKIVARLGEQAIDPIDEFLIQALNFEKNNASSMQGFLHWLESGEIKVKRDMDQGGDMVRIMTVHGAKGLQAPIVFLADTCQTSDMRQEQLLWYDDEEKREKALIWRQKKENLTGIGLAAYKDREAKIKNESKRLLYVAMTRAEDRLYVTGFEDRGSRTLSDDCWYSMIRTAVLGMDGIKEVAEGEETILRLERGGNIVKRDEVKKHEKIKNIMPLPAYAYLPPDHEPTPTKPLTPSRPDEKETVTSPLYRKQSMERENKKYHRGRLIHKLLEILPDINAENRKIVAEKYLSQSAHGLLKKDIQQISKEVMAVLEDERFAALFSDASRAEVPIVGQVGNYTISGFVDRLVIEGNEILIVDYKTNRPPPETADKTPKLYLRQMAAYRKILSDIYPDHTIRSMLLWTDNCSLMEIPDHLLDKIEF